MVELRPELTALIARLERGRLPAGSPEAQALRLLRDIEEVIAGDAGPQQIAQAFDVLRNWWLTSVAWCSALSRQIEKLMIIFDEWFETANSNRPTVE